MKGKEVAREQRFVWVEWQKDKSLGGGGTFKPFALEKQPRRVWTVLTTFEQDKPPTLPFYPVHNQTAFLEDWVHDWNWDNGKFRYYTRVMDRSCWILLEF